MQQDRTSTPIAQAQCSSADTRQLEVGRDLAGADAVISNRALAIADEMLRAEVAEVVLVEHFLRG